MNEIRKWLMWALLSPFVALAEEPAGGVQPSAIDLSLPIHQQKKLHPELSDPVLGDQAQIIEWAWSPQYAKRFGLQQQADGLPDGALWLVGVKIARQQYQQWQAYSCNIVGVMDNTLAILTPPGEYLNNYPLLLGLPGMARGIIEGIEYTPAQSSWHRYPANKAQREKGYGIGTPYIVFIRNYKPDLAYFELKGGCAYFDDPEQFRNELRFPTQPIGKKDEAVFESSAVKFDFPESLIRRVYPYTLDANDWTSCLMRRTGLAGVTLTLRAKKSKRFDNTCEPVTQQAK